jgi:branched-chain amino acid transport system substrate-binding protein
VARATGAVSLTGIAGIAAFTLLATTTPAIARSARSAGSAAGARGAAGAAGSTSGDGRLVIASLAPETGPLARIIQSLREPVRLAVDEINGAGGVTGMPVTLVTADEGTDPQAAATAAELLVEQGADAIVGPASSASALAILRAIGDGALVCSGSNTAAALSGTGRTRTGGLYFRTSPPDRLQGEALGRLVAAGGHERVAIVHATGANAGPVAKAAERTLRAEGVTATRTSFAPGTEPTAAVTRALDRDPDALVVVGDATTGAQVVAAAIAAGHGPGVLPTYGNDGLYDPAFPELVDVSTPGVVAGIRGTVPAADPPGTDVPFHALFAATGVEPFFSSYYYDCTILTALAAVKAGSDDPNAMARVFASNLDGDANCSTFALCTELLDQGRTIHYRGASSAFEAFREWEPGDGVYEVYGFNPAAEAVVEPPDARIAVP